MTSNGNPSAINNPIIKRLMTFNDLAVPVWILRVFRLLIVDGGVGFRLETKVDLLLDHKLNNYQKDWDNVL